MEFSSPPLQELILQLRTSNQGLSSEEAKKRLTLQKKKEKRRSRFERELRLFIKQFENPLVLLLLVAVILSGLMGEITDMVFILLILFATGLLSFFQELNAGRAVEKLQELLAIKVNLFRDGKEVEIPNDELVPGDVVLLKAGDTISADCRILSSDFLHVNESSLTGESFAVEKREGEISESASLSDKTNCLWKGSHIISGSASALVVNVGDDTIFGKLKHSLEVSNDTVFETGLKKFGFFLLKITLVLSIFILGANLFFHKPLADSILFSLAIAVGMAPELLPAIMTLAMTAGAKRMLSKKVIVKKLSAIINLGEVTVLCTDKTGTITEGVSKVHSLVDPTGHESRMVLELAKVNSILQSGFPNPIDEALAKLDCDVSDYIKLGGIPYDFSRRRLTILAQKGKNIQLISKGAVSNILDICTKFQMGETVHPLDETALQKLTEQFESHSQSGLRVLGIASKDCTLTRLEPEDEKDMTFLGFILLEDPLKEGVIDSIGRLKALNTTLKIITGDNRYVAAYTARQIGLDPSKMLVGNDMQTMVPEALRVKAMETEIFAEIEPQQKEAIVRALQKSGIAVAYMGDGINDVAAIHAADTGISVEDAVDVAREAADFVLLEKDLSVLADGIIEGRKTFGNSLKYIFISTGATFGNMFSVAFSSLLLPFLPMLPKQILLVNFLTDFPYLSLSNDRVDEEQLAKPNKWNLGLIQKFMIVFGLHSSVFDLITFYYLFFFLREKESAFQTGWFLESVVTELLILFIIRSVKPVFKSRPSGLLLFSAASMILTTLACMFSAIAPLLGLQPLPLVPMLVISAILVAYLFTGDWLKILFFRYVKA